MGRRALEPYTRWGFAALLAVGLLAGEALTSGAFTLVTVTVVLKPTSGLPTSPFTAEGIFPANCANSPGPYTFNFYWDTTSNKPFWSAAGVYCDRVTSKFDTGPSPAVVPPSGQNKVGTHKVIVAMIDGVTGQGLGAGTHAYTIVWGKPYVTVNPTSGLPTAQFTIHGKYVWPVPCPVTRAPVPITFKFYWYKIASNRLPLWSTTATTCSGSTVDAGTSPSLQPPAPLNYATTFVIQVVALDASGAAFGGAYGAPYTNTTLYKVLAAPTPSASASTSPPCGLPGQLACPSPSPTACTVPAAVFTPAAPGGADVAVMFALLVAGTIPIGGIAMIASPGILRRRGTLARLAALLGLSLILLTASECTWLSPPPQASRATPSQVESPSSSPSSACQV